MKNVLFITVFFTLLTVLKIQGQEIETLWDIEVTTASKSAEKLSDAPGVISVITHEEILNFGSTNLGDILNRITSVYMIHAGTYMWNIASIRGQNVSVFDNHVLILINGRPLRDGISGGHNNVFYNSFPAEGIERIEIIRGPGSVLYGTNAFAGVINIIPNKAAKETQFQSTVSYGSFNTKAINFGGGIHLSDDLNINLGGRWYDDDGSDFGGIFDGRILKPDGTVKSSSKTETKNWTRDNKSLFINLNYKALSLTAGYADMNPFSFTPPIKWNWKNQKAGDEISLMQHFFSDLGYTYQINNSYSLSANLTSNGHYWNGMVDSVSNQLKAASNNLLAEASFQGSPIENLNFILGGVYDINSFKGPLFNKDGQLVNMNAYFQVDYKLLEKLKLIAGAQMNKPQGFDVNFSPRAGAIFNMNDNFGVKALYSTAFRSPYPQETNVYHPLYSGNPNLTPELINTSEFQAFYQNEKLQATLTFYKSHMTNLINKIKGSDSVGVYNGSATYATFYNDGEFDFMGVEFEGKISLSEKISFFTNLTYQQNEEGKDANGAAISNAAIWPNIMAKGGIMYSGEKISGGIYNSYFRVPTQVNYILEQQDKPTIEGLNPEAKAYNLLSMNICFDIFKLLNKDYKTSLKFGIYGDNPLNESIWFPEFARYELNTLPLHAGRSIYGKLAFGF